MILNSNNKNKARKYFERVIDMGLEFKLQDKVTPKHLSIEEGTKLLVDFPEDGVSLDTILKESLYLFLHFSISQHHWQEFRHG